MARASELRMVQNLIQQYYQNPDQFTDDQVEQLLQMTSMYGVPFKPRSSLGRKAGIAIGNLLDTALFGLIPNDMYPKAFTKGERMAANMGDIGGLLLPVGGPMLAARGAYKLAKPAAMAGYEGLLGLARGAKMPQFAGNMMSKAGNMMGGNVGAFIKNLMSKVMNGTATQAEKQALNEIMMKAGYRGGSAAL